jgi:hypothetical protein
METDSQEEISVDDEGEKLPPHQESSHSEDSGDDEEEEPESDMWQTRSNRCVGAALSFTGPPPGLTTPYTACNSTPLEFLKLFFYKFSSYVQETNRYCHQ